MRRGLRNCWRSSFKLIFSRLGIRQFSSIFLLSEENITRSTYICARHWPGESSFIDEECADEKCAVIDTHTSALILQESWFLIKALRLKRGSRRNGDRFPKQQAPKVQGSRGDRGHAPPGSCFSSLNHS